MAFRKEADVVPDLHHTVHVVRVDHSGDVIVLGDTTDEVIYGDGSLGI